MPGTTITHTTPRQLVDRRHTPRPIDEVAAELDLAPDEYEPYGRYKAKIDLAVLDRIGGRPRGRYIDVTAITPTPLGEGKTVTAIGLGQGLRAIGARAITCLREPSLGPVFGIKGGGAGGGLAQVVPMDEVNLHLTGDIHAVGAANNLLAAMIDNHLHFGNALEIAPETIQWRRVLDVSDRALRQVRIGLGPKINGPERDTGFDITVASEVMAILGLATSLPDLRSRLARIVVGSTTAGGPVTAEDLECAGAMAVLLRDALKPNLVQNMEGGAVLVHTGPFGNIAHGNSSVLADQIGLGLADFVVTESGFAADLGAEKFMNIKCRVSGLHPDCVVIVASVRALKAHSGRFAVTPGKPLPPELVREDLDALESGLPNLVKHIESMRLFGVPVVVAVNAFETDTEREHATIRERALEAGAVAAVTHTAFGSGGEGAVALAEAVIAACDRPAAFRFLYDLEAPIEQKIETIASAIYGADGVDYADTAREQIAMYEQQGFDTLPVCIAKTHLSLSDNPALKGRPSGFRLSVREIRLAAGAGFLIPLCGDISRMPGLPRIPAATRIDVDATGKPTGLV
jgi:formate--tetrahydrofolate ligase